MSSRDAILGRIRQSLAGDPPLDTPPVPEVWAETGATTAQMAERFVTELEAVSGEVHRVGSTEDARAKLAELLAGLKAGKVGAMDRPICRELVADLPAEQFDWGTSEGEPKAMAELSAALIASGPNMYRSNVLSHGSVPSAGKWYRRAPVGTGISRAS